MLRSAIATMQLSIFSGAIQGSLSPSGLAFETRLRKSFFGFRDSRELNLLLEPQAVVQLHFRASDYIQDRRSPTWATLRIT